MTEYTHTINIIVPLAIVDEANYFASIIDPDTGGNKTFGNLQLSADGSEPATHTGATGKIKQIVVDWLNELYQGIIPGVFVEAGATQEQLLTLLPMMTIGIDEPWQTTLDRAGVMMISDPVLA
ncbi:MAG: hypothetical protein GXY44_05055 [Phycisphaerales bacterium]|nr:hypothetical protein [Phycisphaerales bacterium]